ncbi:hypothetical protein ACUXG4_006086 [Cupriavidus metallidurans]
MLAPVNPKKSPLRHTVRRQPWFAGLLLLVFLTVQLAASAYACTGSRYQMDGGNEPAALTESCPDMADNGSDQASDQKALCLGHCQADGKSADHVSPQIPAFLPVLVNVIAPRRTTVAERQTALCADAQPRAPPPPLSILHCCFRT